MSRDDELRELLSALVDGELDDGEAAEVRDLLERSPEARDELDGIVRVRATLRGQDAAEPPAGFFEDLLARGPEPAPAAPVPITAARSARSRSAARRWLEIGGGAVAAAAVVVVLLGITPVTDRIAPPVEAYAARHDALAEGAVEPAPVGTTVAPSTAPPGSAVPGETFTAVGPAELDAAGAPARVATFDRRAGYHGTSGVMQVLYAHDDFVVSVYVQAGTVAWDRLPPGGATLQLGDDKAWVRAAAGEEVLVVERNLTVYTVVGQHQPMLDVVDAMPEPPDPSMPTRVRLFCRSVVDGVGLGD